MARRSKLTPAVQKKIVQAIKLGATHALAAQYANITATTLYNWLRAGEAGRSPVKVAFFQAFKEAEASHGLGALAAIHRAHKDGSWQAAAWLLERRHAYTRDGSAARQPEPKTSAVELTELEQLGKARREAFASGSFVAGATLMREEARMKDELKQAEKEREASEALGATDDQIFEDILQDLRLLPAAARTRIARSLLGPAELVTDDA